MSETVPGEFQKEIDCLAQGVTADLKRVAQAKKPKSRRRLSILIGTGITLALAEIVLLVIQLRISSEQTARSGRPAPNSLISRNDCNAAAYKAYRGIASFMRDNGAPPRALADLVGPYLDRLPADPKTGQSLLYASDGPRFSLRCP